MVDKKVMTFDILSEKIMKLKEEGYDRINVDDLLDFVEKVKQSVANINSLKKMEIDEQIKSNN